MSSAVVSTSAAAGRPFLFDDEPEDEVCSLPSDKKPSGNEKSPIAQALHSAINHRQSTIPLVTPASRLEIRPAPEMVSSGIPVLDALIGGLPRGCLTEICGPASSGRTSVMLATLAAATRRGEYCALIDASDALDPYSLSATGVDLDRMLWIRCSDHASQKLQSRKDGCPISRAPSAREAGVFEPTALNFDREKTRASEHRLEQVLRATDLLLESGGFGLIVLDLSDLPPQAARRIPLTTWFRFRRAVEHKLTILLTIEQQPIAGSCSSLLLQLRDAKSPFATSYKPAVKQRENAAHRVSRGFNAEADQAQKGRKTICAGENGPPEFGSPSHAQLLTGLEISVELIRSRLDRKPTRSMTFETKTAWAG